MFFLLFIYIRYAQSTATGAKSLGWQANDVFVVNESLQLDEEGRPVPPEEYNVILVPSLLAGIPVPPTRALNADSGLHLYDVLKCSLPESAYMASIMLGGECVSHKHSIMFSYIFCIVNLLFLI